MFCQLYSAKHLKNPRKKLTNTNKTIEINGCSNEYCEKKNSFIRRKPRDYSLSLMYKEFYIIKSTQKMHKAGTPLMDKNNITIQENKIVLISFKFFFHLVVFQLFV